MKIYVNSEKAFVFNVSDASILREKHRIAGVLVGCFSRKPRQNAYLGLPLQLMPEEATLLREKGIAEFVGQKSEVKDTTADEVCQYQSHLDKVYEEQAVLSREDRLKDIRSRKESIIAGKKAKRRKLLEESGKTGDVEVEEDAEFNIEDIVIKPLQRSSTLVQIPTVSWRGVEQEPVKWDFPSTETEHLRYKVFKKLWEDGYFLTSASKFGGDFLVYPGDPARYHSFYIAVCTLPTKKFSPLFLANMGRLAATVKKTVLLCSLNDQNQVTFTSLNWSHIS